MSPKRKTFVVNSPAQPSSSSPTQPSSILSLLPSLSEYLAARPGPHRLSQHCNYSLLSGQDLLAERYAAFAALAVCQNPVASAVLAAVDKEIERRLARNFANRLFGVFLLAVKTGNSQLEADSYAELRRFAFGILKQKWPGHNRHYDHPDVWVECIHDVLQGELKKYCHLSPVDVWERLLDNGFAYIHKALRCEFIDEWRNVYRRLGREVRLDDRHGYLPTLAVRDEEREALAKGLEEQAARFDAQGRPGPAETLRQNAAYARDPDGWEAMYGPYPRAVSKAVSKARGVCVRSGQRDVEALKEAAKTSEELQALKAKLRDSVERSGPKTAVEMSHSELDDE